MKKFGAFLVLLLSSLVLMAIWAPLGIAVLVISIIAVPFALLQSKPDTVSAQTETNPNPNPNPEPQSMRETKSCPLCAEEILAAALKCKHCGSDIKAAVAI